MKILTLRHFWSLIEGMQANTLLRLSDAELVRQLLIQLEREFRLNADEIPGVSIYIHSKLPLICDLAQARLA